LPKKTDRQLRAGTRINTEGTQMRKIQTQGLHHVTLVGADRQSTIDFWEGVLGMPFIFDQPNLDRPSEGHLYFDPGDGRLITVFTNEDRKPPHRHAGTEVGAMHHVAFSVSFATYRQVVTRLDARGIKHSGPKDRGFMDSVYFEDPCGLLVELACYKFEPPMGCSHADVMIAAHRIRVAAGDHHIMEIHLADAIELLVARRQQSLSMDRGPKDPYGA
jgi:glyoxalase family protein